MLELMGNHDPENSSPANSMMLAFNLLDSSYCDVSRVLCRNVPQYPRPTLCNERQGHVPSLADAGSRFSSAASGTGALPSLGFLTSAHEKVEGQIAS